ncbi:hypothetical protein [Pseudoclavibacter terrae]|uniref:Uncharacterized protein n=1 Tax=Pseudoclavibacter terrae TaxID=1530195 RepID=A0A7J5B8Q3_9MICO|nr:hypothetical protein [Pseudoclavibacter terrae]KAB1639700.1 hypothetical protein F8O03_05105 [Pseudoclavibacter terrae]
MTQLEDPYAWPTPPPKLPKKRRQTDDGDLVQDHSAPDFGQEVNKLILRVLGDLVRADESLLDRPEELAELGRERVFDIADDHVLIDYELDTGGAPSSNAMGHAGLIRADDLEARVDNAVEFMQLSHITNDEHREMQRRRGRAGGKRSKRGKGFTLNDFAPHAHLTNKAAAEEMRCSPRTVASLRKLYRETVTKSVQTKPTNPPEGDQAEGDRQELPAAAQQVEDTPEHQLSVYYSHEDEPEPPEFLDDYTYEHLLFLKHSQRLRNDLRRAEMTDADWRLAQHWSAEDYANSRISTTVDRREWDELQAFIDALEMTDSSV